jgi:hypothetical protein
MELTKNSFITIDKFKIWEIDYNFDDIDVPAFEDSCGIKNQAFKNQKMSQEFYLYQIVDKEKFIFAAMKYNINFNVVNIEDYE